VGESEAFDAGGSGRRSCLEKVVGEQPTAALTANS